ncbi:MAG TPA: hypothetical protein VND92_04740, partial [Vicinamibacterales bacterium]|nr:hypothetical protein [Vicinamibacterales bacterium]
HDEEQGRTSVDNTFGLQLPVAMSLVLHRPLRVWVEPVLPEAALAGLSPPDPRDVRAHLVIAPDGRVRVTPLEPARQRTGSGGSGLVASRVERARALTVPAALR